MINVELDREHEAMFYKTMKGINKYHQVVISQDDMQGKEKSTVASTTLKMGETKERKTKRSRAKGAEQEEAAEVELEAQLDECQKCCNKPKKGESLNEWICCEGCDRTWHKTSVGIEEDTPLDEISWSHCGKCGGKDPRGKMLKKRRKVGQCPVCFKRTRGGDHSMCRQERAKAAENFVTPMAEVKKKKCSKCPP